MFFLLSHFTPQEYRRCKYNQPNDSPGRRPDPVDQCNWATPEDVKSLDRHRVVHLLGLSFPSETTPARSIITQTIRVTMLAIVYVRMHAGRMPVINAMQLAPRFIGLAFVFAPLYVRPLIFTNVLITAVFLNSQMEFMVAWLNFALILDSRMKVWTWRITARTIAYDRSTFSEFCVVIFHLTHSSWTAFQSTSLAACWPSSCSDAIGVTSCQTNCD